MSTLPSWAGTNLPQRLEDPATRAEAVREIGDWAIATCLVMGASVITAYTVGGTLAQGILDSWETPDTPDTPDTQEPT